MAKRFGRNQRRKLRDQYEQLIERRDRSFRQTQRMQFEAIARLEARLARSIEIDLTSILLPEERAIQFRLSCEHKNNTTLHYAYQVDPHELALTRDREERAKFGAYLGKNMANAMLETASAKWRAIAATRPYSHALEPA